MRLAPTITWLMVGALGLCQIAAPAGAASDYEQVARILSKSSQEREVAAKALIAAADPSLVPGLVDAFFFTPKEARRQILDVLESLTGERYGDYYSWVEWVGSHAEPPPADGYLAWKRSLLSRIDPGYQTVLYDGAPQRIRLEEVVWGGVPMAGIPALDDPPTLVASAARYLRKNEQVFGIVVNGEARAYPLRFLSWHEMLNDTVGGEPLVLSFCTLCGSGIFYSTRTPNGGARRFDTSGLLYRSNKLMVDRRTRTLWSNLTGEPVIGRLAGSPVGLKMLTGTLTRWDEWRRRHPETTVLDLQGIEEQMRPRYSYDYRPGAADRHRRGVSFPVWLSSQALERDRQVFALRLGDGTKAYPLDRLLQAGVVNDVVGGLPIVVVADEASGAVRAYERSSLVLRKTSDGALTDQDGRRWRADESELRPQEPAAGVSALPRVPGHEALWFGWYGFFPDTEVWDG